MTTEAPTREAALSLFKQYNQTESLLKHALAVEGVMRHFARQRGADEEQWGIIGLIHDLDYEQFPTSIAPRAPRFCGARDGPSPTCAPWSATDGGSVRMSNPNPTWRKSSMRWTNSPPGDHHGLVRPSKSVMDLTAKSVKKKWKDKRFAAGVDRAIIDRGGRDARYGPDRLDHGNHHGHA